MYLHITVIKNFAYASGRVFFPFAPGLMSPRMQSDFAPLENSVPGRHSQIFTRVCNSEG